MSAFDGQMQNWPNANWILDLNGLHSSLLLLIKNFRNPAAHINELRRQDFENCRELVLGEQGLLWKLLQATKSHK